MEFAQLDAATRTTEWSRFGAERDPGSIAPPATWTGYLVRPDRLTFWQSGSDGPSHRVEYRLQQDGGWSTSHLAG
jgi:pyridoxamine 5'-phosphate oxidase